MTAVLDTTVDQKLTQLMDDFMVTISGRSLVETSEVLDFVLDMRQVVTNHRKEEDGPAAETSLAQPDPDR